MAQQSPLSSHRLPHLHCFIGSLWTREKLYPC